MEGANSLKTLEAWYVTPLLMLYSTPTCFVKVMTPLGSAQVGCVLIEVGIAGKVGAEIRVNCVALKVTQAVSIVLLTRNV